MAAKERRWRCNNCRSEFKSTKQACAKCDIDAADNPRFSQVIHELKTIHYDPPSKVRGIGLFVRACQPNVRGYAGEMATGEPSVVNCEECRATEVFKANWDGDKTPILPEADEAITPKTPAELKQDAQTAAKVETKAGCC